MEQITQKSHTPSLILPPYLLVVCVIVTTFTAVNAGVRTLAGHTAAPSNPFAAFADVFPGQPRSAVIARGFLCPSMSDYDTYQEMLTETCILRLEGGAFSQVAMVASNGIIIQIEFTMRENTLRIGDLIGLWSRPEVQEYSRSVYLFWRSRGINALVSRDTGGFSLFLPVWTVYFFED